MNAASNVILAHIQFTDLDNVGQALHDFPLRCLPRVGDKINVVETDGYRQLEVEDVIHILRTQDQTVPDHHVTISCKTVSERIQCSK